MFSELLLFQNSMQRRDLTPFLLLFFIYLGKILYKNTVSGYSHNDCYMCLVPGTKFSTYPETKFSTKYLVY
jgi:hypothetical protein